MKKYIFLVLATIAIPVGLLSGNFVLAQNNVDLSNIENNEIKLVRPDAYKKYAELEMTKDLSQISNDVHSDIFISMWTANAIQKILTLNSITDFDLHMDSLAHYFTPNGLKEFRESFEHTGIRRSVEINDFHMTAHLLKRPNVQGSGLMDKGFYQWTVSLPVEVKYIRDHRFKQEGRSSSPVQTSSQEWNLIVLIVRNNDVLNPYGIGIEKWITE